MSHIQETHCRLWFHDPKASHMYMRTIRNGGFRFAAYTVYSQHMQHQGAFLTEETLTVPMLFRLPPNLRSMEAGAADVLTAKHRGILAHDVRPDTMHAAYHMLHGCARDHCSIQLLNADIGQAESRAVEWRSRPFRSGI